MKVNSAKSAMWGRIFTALRAPVQPIRPEKAVSADVPALELTMGPVASRPTQ